MSGPQREPVFWWWDEPAGARVVLLTDDTLVLSGRLSHEQVGALEIARREHRLEAAFFGSYPVEVATPDIANVRLVPASRTVILDLHDGRTKLSIQPSESSAGVAPGIFEELRSRFAPGAEPVDTVTMEMTPDTSERWVVPTLVGLAALAAACGFFVNPLAYIASGTLGAAGFAALLYLGGAGRQVALKRRQQVFEIDPAVHIRETPKRDLLREYRPADDAGDPLGMIDEPTSTSNAQPQAESATKDVWPDVTPAAQAEHQRQQSADADPAPHPAHPPQASPAPPPMQMQPARSQQPPAMPTGTPPAQAPAPAGTTPAAPVEVGSAGLETPQPVAQPRRPPAPPVKAPPAVVKPVIPHRPAAPGASGGDPAPMEPSPAHLSPPEAQTQPDPAPAGAPMTNAGAPRPSWSVAPEPTAQQVDPERAESAVPVDTETLRRQHAARSKS